MNNPPSMGGQAFGFHPNLADFRRPLQRRARWPSSPTSGPSSFRRTRPSTWATRFPSRTPCFRTPTRSRPGRPDAPTSRSARAGAAGRPTLSTRATAAGGGFPTITSISGSSTFCIGLKRPLSIGTGNLNSVLTINGFTGTPESNARRASMDYLRTIDGTATMIAAREPDDPAGARHLDRVRELDAGGRRHHGVSQHEPRQPAQAGRQRHQARQQLAGHQPLRARSSSSRRAVTTRTRTRSPTRPTTSRRSRPPCSPSTTRRWSWASRARSPRLR